MSPAILLLLALGLGLAGWLAARARAWAFRRDSADGRLPSLPVYHAWYVALWVILPMVAFIALWSAIAPGLVTQQVLASPAAAELPAFGFQRQTILNEARAVATGAASAVFNPQASGLVEPYERTRELLGEVAEILVRLPNRVAISGHTDANPVAGRPGYSNWELTADRANATRRILESSGLSNDRIYQVVGKADSEPLFPEDPYMAANRRLSILLLREAPVTPPGFSP